MELNHYQKQVLSEVSATEDNYIYMMHGTSAALGKLNGIISKCIGDNLVTIEDNQVRFTEDVTIDQRNAIYNDIKVSLGELYRKVTGLTHTLCFSIEDIAASSIK